MEDGFNLDVHLRTQTLPQWLVFDVSTGTFTGVATNSDVGNVPVRLVATDTEGLSSPPDTIQILVERDFRPDPLFVGVIAMDLPIVVPNLGGRRRAIVTNSDGSACNDELDGTARVLLVQGIALFFGLPESEINLLSVGTKPGNCDMTVRFGLNNVDSCDDAVDQEERLQVGLADGTFARALNSRGTLFRVNDISTEAQVCEAPVVPFITANAQDTFKKTALPAVILGSIAAVLLLIAMLVLRRRSNYKERGLDDTFKPRQPILLQTDRVLQATEFDRQLPALLESEPWLDDKGPGHVSALAPFSPLVGSALGRGTASEIHRPMTGSLAHPWFPSLPITAL